LLLHAAPGEHDPHVFGTNNNFTGPVQEMVAELQKRLGLGD